MCKGVPDFSLNNKNKKVKQRQSLRVSDRIKIVGATEVCLLIHVQ